MEKTYANAARPLSQCRADFQPPPGDQLWQKGALKNSLAESLQVLQRGVLITSSGELIS
jgi:hypothetical protein